jgi:hypothetical protein
MRIPKSALVQAFTMAWFAVGAASSQAAIATAEPAPESAAARLRAVHAQVAEQLEKNDFGRRIHLDSRDNGRDLKGDVFAVVGQPFATVASSLHDASSWCEILMLPYNTKHCTSDEGKALTLYVGKKKETPVADAQRLDFKYQVAAQDKEYLQVMLTADAGPLGTKNYRISLEATPIDKGHTFLHLSYAYTYGTVSNFAMQVYLATAGASKVGFTVEGRDGEGQPQYVKGMRGVIERNTMRYFLAIDAYLESLAATPGSRLDKRLNGWFTASERYPRQLHEMERGDYVTMKQREMERVQAAKVAGT